MYELYLNVILGSAKPMHSHDLINRIIKIKNYISKSEDDEQDAWSERKEQKEYLVTKVTEASSDDRSDSKLVLSFHLDYFISLLSVKTCIVDEYHGADASRHFR